MRSSRAMARTILGRVLHLATLMRLFRYCQYLELRCRLLTSLSILQLAHLRHSSSHEGIEGSLTSLLLLMVVSYGSVLTVFVMTGSALVLKFTLSRLIGLSMELKRLNEGIENMIDN